MESASSSAADNSTSPLSNVSDSLIGGRDREDAGDKNEMVSVPRSKPSAALLSNSSSVFSSPPSQSRTDGGHNPTKNAERDTAGPTDATAAESDPQVSAEAEDGGVTKAKSEGSRAAVSDNETKPKAPAKNTHNKTNNNESKTRQQHSNITLQRGRGGSNKRAWEKDSKVYHACAWNYSAVDHGSYRSGSTSGNTGKQHQHQHQQSGNTISSTSEIGTCCWPTIAPTLVLRHTEYDALKERAKNKSTSCAAVEMTRAAKRESASAMAAEAAEKNDTTSDDKIIHRMTLRKGPTPSHQELRAFTAEYLTARGRSASSARNKKAVVKPQHDYEPSPLPSTSEGRQQLPTSHRRSSSRNRDRRHLQGGQTNDQLAVNLNTSGASISETPSRTKKGLTPTAAELLAFKQKHYGGTTKTTKTGHQHHGDESGGSTLACSSSPAHTPRKNSAQTENSNEMQKNVASRLGSTGGRGGAASRGMSSSNARTATQRRSTVQHTNSWNSGAVDGADIGRRLGEQLQEEYLFQRFLPQRQKLSLQQQQGEEELQMVGNEEHHRKHRAVGANNEAAAPTDVSNKRKTKGPTPTRVELQTFCAGYLTERQRHVKYEVMEKHGDGEEDQWEDDDADADHDEDSDIDGQQRKGPTPTAADLRMFNTRVRRQRQDLALRRQCDGTWWLSLPKQKTQTQTTAKREVEEQETASPKKKQTKRIRPPFHVPGVPAPYDYTALLLAGMRGTGGRKGCRWVGGRWRRVPSTSGRGAAMGTARTLRRRSHYRYFNRQAFLRSYTHRINLRHRRFIERLISDGDGRAEHQARRFYRGYLWSAQNVRKVASKQRGTSFDGPPQSRGTHHARFLTRYVDSKKSNRTCLHGLVAGWRRLLLSSTTSDVSRRRENAACSTSSPGDAFARSHSEGRAGKCHLQKKEYIYRKGSSIKKVSNSSTGRQSTPKDPAKEGEKVIKQAARKFLPVATDKPQGATPKPVTTVKQHRRNKPIIQPTNGSRKQEGKVERPSVVTSPPKKVTSRVDDDEETNTMWTTIPSLSTRCSVVECGRHNPDGKGTKMKRRESAHLHPQGQGRNDHQRMPTTSATARHNQQKHTHLGGKKHSEQVINMNVLKEKQGVKGTGTGDSILDDVSAILHYGLDDGQGKNEDDGTKGCGKQRKSPNVIKTNERGTVNATVNTTASTANATATSLSSGVTAPLVDESSSIAPSSQNRTKVNKEGRHSEHRSRSSGATATNRVTSSTSTLDIMSSYDTTLPSHHYAMSQLDTEYELLVGALLKSLFYKIDCYATQVLQPADLPDTTTLSAATALTLTTAAEGGHHHQPRSSAFMQAATVISTSPINTNVQSNSSPRRNLRCKGYFTFGQLVSCLCDCFLQDNDSDKEANGDDEIKGVDIEDSTKAYNNKKRDQQLKTALGGLKNRGILRSRLENIIRTCVERNWLEETPRGLSQQRDAEERAVRDDDDDGHGRPSYIKSNKNIDKRNEKSSKMTLFAYSDWVSLAVRIFRLADPRGRHSSHNKTTITGIDTHVSSSVGTQRSGVVQEQIDLLLTLGMTVDHLLILLEH